MEYFASRRDDLQLVLHLNSKQMHFIFHAKGNIRHSWKHFSAVIEILSLKQCKTSKGDAKMRH